MNTRQSFVPGRALESQYAPFLARSGSHSDCWRTREDWMFLDGSTVTAGYLEFGGAWAESGPFSSIPDDHDTIAAHFRGTVAVDEEIGAKFRGWIVAHERRETRRGSYAAFLRLLHREGVTEKLRYGREEDRAAAEYHGWGHYRYTVPGRAPVVVLAHGARNRVEMLPPEAIPAGEWVRQEYAWMSGLPGFMTSERYDGPETGGVDWFA